MKTKDLRPLKIAVSSRFPGLAPGPGPLIVAQPLEEILRGLYFEDSGLDRVSFYVWAFVQPLYVPDSTVSFYLGDRLGGGGGPRWQIDRTETAGEVLEAIERDGLPFLETMKSPELLARAIELRPDRNDVYIRQTYAYSLLYAGQPGAARELRALASDLTPSVPWQLEMKTRAEELAVLATEDAAAAHRRLLAWVEETKKKLRLS